MRLVFLKTGLMNEHIGEGEYEGIETEKNSWDINDDESEQSNFLQRNEYCYGFVSTSNKAGEYEEIHIEKLEGISNNDDVADNVIAVWITSGYESPGSARVIGWYRDARLYRTYQNIGTSFYNIIAEAKNCILLPTDKRYIALKITNYGNVLFYSDIENRDAYEEILSYIYDYSGGRLNIVVTEDDLSRESDEMLGTGEEYLEKAEKLYEEKRNLEALYSCNSALKHGCFDADAYNLKGLILYELYQYNESMKCYLKAIQIYPHFYEVFYNMALVYEENKDFENALINYDKYIEYCPDSPEGFSGKGQIYIQTQEYEKALECFNKAIFCGTMDMDVYAFQAIALWNVGRLRDALYSIEHAIELCPDDESNINIKNAILEELRRSC